MMEVSSLMKLPSRILSAGVLLACAAAAQPMGKPETIVLWPGGAPGFRPSGEEQNMTTAEDRMVSGKSVLRLGNVSNPTMTIYAPPKGKANGASIVVFPGGGYRIVAYDLEGTEVCEWLNGLGITCALVKYRVPSPEGASRHASPLQDAQRAVGWLRHHAAQRGLDPSRIGVLGFSAGGHLSAVLSTNFDKRTYDRVDAADEASCRPDFTVLIYPAYLTTREDLTKVSPELAITPKTPPVFIVQTQDDSVPVEGSLFFYAALKAHKVPAEMHLYSKGGHGYGLRPSADPVSEWPSRAEAWLRRIGVLR